MCLCLTADHYLLFLNVGSSERLKLFLTYYFVSKPSYFVMLYRICRIYRIYRICPICPIYRPCRLIEAHKQAVPNSIEEVLSNTTKIEFDWMDFPPTWSSIAIANNLSILEHHLYSKISTRLVLVLTFIIFKLAHLFSLSALLCVNF